MSPNGTVRLADSPGATSSGAVMAILKARHAKRHTTPAPTLAAPRAAPVPLSMHVSFALFADAANLSQEGKLNVLGVFDAVQVSTLPAVHPRAHLVVRLKGTPHDVGVHSMTLHWINPGGLELWSTAGQIEITPPPAAVVEMDFPLIAPVDLPLDQAGNYVMRIKLDNEARADVHLQVRTTAAMMPTSGMVS